MPVFKNEDIMRELKLMRREFKKELKNINDRIYWLADTDKFKDAKQIVTQFAAIQSGHEYLTFVTEKLNKRIKTLEEPEQCKNVTN
jgi:hypothetical protein